MTQRFARRVAAIALLAWGVGVIYGVAWAAIATAVLLLLFDGLAGRKA